MGSPLENLSGPGKSLQKESPDAQEFEGLKRSGLVRLADATRVANSLEGPVLILLTTRLTHSAWRHCVCTVIDPPIVTWFCKFYPIRLAWDRRFGVCWLSAMIFAIVGNTRAI